MSWRAWGLAEDEHGPVLASPEFGKHIRGLTYGEREAWARCLEQDHTPPKARCSCGLYSADSAHAAQTWLPTNSVAVVGKVKLLGRVIEGAPGVANVAMSGVMPIIGAAIGRHTSAEFRSAGVRLKGTQRLHPDHAASADALADRYGVPFRVDPSLAERFDVAEELIAASRRLLGYSGDAAGLVLFNKDRSHVVLQLRSQLVDHPNTWAFIGGAIEPGETPTDAALREAWEEAMLDPATIRVEREVDLPGYTYVIATTDWTPEQDWVLPNSCNAEAQGAAWLPVAAMAKLPLHPKLRWPL